MSHGIGGWLWLVIDVLFAAALAAALIYGTTMWRNWRRHPVKAEEREHATREVFEGQQESAAAGALTPLKPLSIRPADFPA